MKKIIFALLLLLIFIPSVFAGTIVGASKVEFGSNFNGFQSGDEVIVTTWSTTPAANDVFFFTNDNLPDEYKLDDGRITIEVNKPIFNQIFEVTNQQPLYKLEFYEKTFLGFFGLTRESAERGCIEKIQEELSGRTILPGTKVVKYSTAYTCQPKAILVTQQKGWLGKADHTSWDYKQDIRVGGQSLHLESSRETVQVADRIDNVAAVTLLGFSQWFNAELTDNQVYGYHGRNDLGSDDWRPYRDDGSTSTYRNEIQQLSETFSLSTFPNPDSFFDDGYISSLKRDVAVINAQADDISAGLPIPQVWEGNAEINNIQYAGNEIIVPIKKTTLTANMQFLISGDRFGLSRLTGVPKIVSADSELRFDERENGFLSYEVKNVGDNQGSFVLYSTCNDPDITSDNLYFTLDAGESERGELRHTSKTSDLSADATFTCTLIFKENQEDIQDEKLYNVIVANKGQCTSGETSEPVILDGKEVIYTYDDECNIIDTTECDGLFKRDLLGNWKCEEKDVDTTPDEGQFNKPIFWVATILGLVIGGFAYANLRSLAIKNNYLHIALIILSIAIAIGVFVGVAYLVGAVEGLFTFNFG